jgi:hypothetical protein
MDQIMRFRLTIFSAASAVTVLGIAASVAPAQAALGWFDQRNYMRCIAYAVDDAANMPAGSQRNAAYETMRRACYQKFFLDRLGIAL